MKKLAFLLSFIVISTLASAQDRIEVGLTAIPSLTIFHTANSSTSLEPIFTFNYGVRVNWRKNSRIFSTGLLHFTQGAKQEWEKTSSDNPEGTGEFFDVYIRTKTITIPLNVDYTFASTGKTEFFGGVGIYIGYMYSEQLENTSIPENNNPDSVILPSGNQFPITGPVTSRFTETNAFEDLYFGAKVGVGIRQALGNNLSLQFRPNLLFQLRKELPKETHSETLRMMSFNAEIGIYYSF